MTKLFFLQSGMGGSGALTPVFLVLMLAVFYFFLDSTTAKKGQRTRNFYHRYEKR